MKRFFSIALIFCFAAIEALPVVISEEAAEATQSWLSMVDQEKLSDSWECASETFRKTMPQQDWSALMESNRKPLGRVISRDMFDRQEVANPKRLPKGEYQLVYFQTTFSNKPVSIELVTLHLEDGKWKVFTYLVK